MTEEKLIEFIKTNYRPQDGGLTSQHSYGNYDDVFADGYSSGKSVTLKEIADLMGIEVPPLKQQDFEW